MVIINDGIEGSIVNITMDTNLLGGHTNVEVLATAGYKLARSYEDIDAIHANIFSTLNTPDVPDDVQQYRYVIIKSGEHITAVADAWISSITVVNKITATIRNIELDSLDDLMLIRTTLAGIGFDALDITTSEV